jgi:hypothetical protein
MRRVRLRLLVDSVLLVGAFVTFASGLVLLLGLHVGDGTARASALGLGRLAWLNLHRLPALTTLLALGLHIALDRRAFATRLRRIFRRDAAVPHGRADTVMCLAMLTVVLAGLAAWLLVGGSAPLLGPAPLGPLPEPRHRWIDVHHVAGVVSLPLVTHHVAHRWRWMVRTFQSLAR